MKKNILYILIGVLVILNLKIILDISNIDRRVNETDNKINILNMSISSIQSNVSSTIQSMYEEKKWLYNTQFNIKNLSKDLKNVDIELNWSIRELGRDYKVYLLYGVEDEKQGQVTGWKEVAAEDMGNLNYKSQLTLPYQNNYQFKVLARNDINTISERLTEKRFLSNLNERISIEARPMTKTASNNHVNMKFMVDISNRYQPYIENYQSDIDEDILKMKNVDIKIYSSGNLKKEISILKDGKLVEGTAKKDEPFRMEKDMRMEWISFESNIQYDTQDNSYEEIEVIVEDYMGKIYSQKSHGI